MFTVNTSLHIFCIVNFLLKNTQQQNCCTNFIKICLFKYLRYVLIFQKFDALKYQKTRINYIYSKLFANRIKNLFKYFFSKFFCFFTFLA